MKKINLANKLRLFVVVLSLAIISIAAVGVKRGGDIHREGNGAQLQVLGTSLDEGRSEAQSQFDAKRLMQVQQIQTATEERRQTNALYIFSALVMVLLLIAAGTEWLVRSFRQPLQEAIAFAQQIAQGDLRAELTEQYDDEFGDLLLALQTMQQSLTTVVADVRNASVMVTHVGGQLVTDALLLSQQTQAQAASLERTTQHVGLSLIHI